MLLGSQDSADWECFGKFLGKVRQTRRKFVKRCLGIVRNIAMNGFVAQKREWRAQGRHVCRHGVFFDTFGQVSCPCLEPLDVQDARWLDAKRMPALDSELKALIAVPFDAASFNRLGILQAEAHRRDW